MIFTTAEWGDLTTPFSVRENFPFIAQPPNFDVAKLG
jgi:hypothetical protein